MDPSLRMADRLTVVLVLLALALAALPAAAVVVGPPRDGEADATGTPDVNQDPAAVVFGAVGDFDNKAPTYPDMVALAKRLGNRGGKFLLALGDLGYVADEQQWCGAIKGAFNNTLVVAGNHDTTENGPGDINNDVVYCPFNMDASLVPGPTYGYGKSYYFDYPRASPLVRVIMITAGVAGTQVSGQNYGYGGAEHTWVVNAVKGARSAGVPWVVVGLHKMCITVGSKTGCQMGQAMFDELVNLKVDLILQGHDHVYERSKQLALGAACATVPAAGGFDGDCVVASGDAFTKGAGSIAVVDGAGGRDLYTVTLNGTDKEMGYFEAVMGTNANTEGKSSGHGAIVVRLNATTLTGTTDFCPLGSGDSGGECATKVATTFSDRFTISQAPSPPPPSGKPTASFTVSPAWPGSGESVTFNASASSDTNPGVALQLRWDWTNDGTFDTDWSADRVATHAYAAAGTYTARLQIQDSLGLMDNTTRSIGVDGAAPVTVASVSGPVGDHGWYRGNATVSLVATDDVSGVSGTWARRDNASWVETHSVTFVDDRAHALDYYSTDVAGHTEATSRVSVPVDATLPVTTASLQGSLDGNGSYLVSVNVTLDALDATSGVASITYWVDGGLAHAYGSPFLVQGSGTHTLRISSTDLAGNIEIAHSVSFTITSTPSPAPVPPTSTLSLDGTLGTSGWYTSVATATLTATSASTASVTITYRIDGGVWTVYQVPLSLGDGLHLLEYYASDDRGVREGTHSASVQVDTVAPTTAVKLTGTGGRDHWYVSPVSVLLSASDLTSGVASTEARVDGGPWSPYTAPVTLGSGRHLLEYRSADLAGMREVTSSLPIKVDLNPPKIAVQTASGVVPASSIRFSWTASDDVAGVVENAVRVDDGPFVELGLNTTLALELSDGAHTVLIRATDEAGNAAFDAATLKVDTNVFSPTGPYRGIPSYAILMLALGSLILLVAHRRRSRRSRRRKAAPHLNPRYR